jgi:carbonic anhydrase/acetyltransferase-like protein (isoleucine patch superfamily)
LRQNTEKTTKAREKMEKLCEDYTINVTELSQRLRSDESFDIIKRTLRTGGKELCFFYIDGFVKDSVLFRHVTIGAGCDIDKCLIMNDTVVGEGSILKHVILDKDVVVYPGAKLIGTPTTPVIIKRGDKV